MSKAQIKKENLEKIVVAMSGGVDSSTVAAMLSQENKEIIGITLQLYDHGAIINKKGACCAGQDIYDAAMVASKLNIPHYVLDYESRFKQSVIDDFVDSYLKGETPLPCVKCNQSVKFNDLINFAKELGAQKLVTGHYVQKIHTKQGPEMHKGLDPKKDQSYFLFATTKEQLEFLDFPLGRLSKEETRQYARKFGLINSDKADSQDICFVPDGSYAALIKKLRPDAIKTGVIMHIDGYALGEHDGIVNYTIGQRKGIGVSFSEPLYVVKLDPDKNIVYVGPESALEASTFKIKDVNWLDHKPPVEGLEVTVKIRSTHNGAEAKIYPIDNTSIFVKLLSLERAITPGQACVIYNDTRVLGGGWITKE
ncbi:MAG: tRNA 2-thiouridine(34) synthase MnmA [Rickettsiaceae bacterium]|nr:tRNA 2-thiouridine(34) synthase MnmA [Rickettsiaceae bacterium]